MKVFFDTSSFIKKYVEEVGSQDVDSVIEKASELGLSIICFAEMISALNSKLKSNHISQGVYLELKDSILEDIEDAEIINLTPNVLKKVTVLLEENILRTLDAIHIACALEWGAGQFISSDKRQIKAAIKSGLNVIYIEGMKSDK